MYKRQLFSKELENMKLKLKAANKELDSDKLKKYDDKMKASANSYTCLLYTSRCV